DRPARYGRTTAVGRAAATGPPRRASRPPGPARGAATGSGCACFTSWSVAVGVEKPPTSRVDLQLEVVRRAHGPEGRQRDLPGGADVELKGHRCSPPSGMGPAPAKASDVGHFRRLVGPAWLRSLLRRRRPGASARGAT